jgi:hypothetical protein
MGLADRDYMRDRHRRIRQEEPFRPPQPKTPLLGIVVFCLVAGFILMKMLSWHKESRAVHKQTLSSSARAPMSSPKNAEPAPPISEAPRTAATPQEKKVWRCEQDGQVLYSDQGCDRSVAMRSVPPSEDRGPVPSSVETPRNHIYLCKAYDGGLFWSSAHCNQQRAHIERIAPVPPGLSFNEQVAIAQQQRDAARSVSENTYVAPVQSAQGPSVLKARCAALDEAIRAIDARARQPLPAFEQDRLATERKRLRDQQFRMRCA